MNTQKALMVAGLGLASWLGYRTYRASTAFRYRDKTVLITGGTRGLGLVIARQLAREGANLAVCAATPMKFTAPKKTCPAAASAWSPAPVTCAIRTACAISWTRCAASSAPSTC